MTVEVTSPALGTHLQEGVEEYLCERLRHGEMAVAGADLKGRLQTLYGNCDVNERNHMVDFGGHVWVCGI